MDLAFEFDTTIGRPAWEPAIGRPVIKSETCGLCRRLVQLRLKVKPMVLTGEKNPRKNFYKCL